MKQTVSTFFRPSFAKFFTKIVLIGLVFFTLVLPQTIQAAPRRGYEAKTIDVPKESIVMAPGETKTVSLSYKNVGKTTWKRKGSGYISFYTTEKKYRKSIFEAPNWFDATHAALLKETSVKSGSVGTFKLVLHAPTKEGTYKESFGMVAEDITWVPGGELKLEIEVKKGGEKLGEVGKVVGVPLVGTHAVKKSEKTNAKVATATTAPTLSGMLLLRSHKIVEAQAGEEIAYKIGIKNTGTIPWTKREVRINAEIVAASVSIPSTQSIVMNTDGEVAPGAIDFLSFAFVAPTQKGHHTITYQFAANDVVLPEVKIEIPIEVTEDAGDIFDAPLAVDPSQTLELNVINEPIMRIGVLIVDEETDNQVQVSCNSSWKLFDGEGALLAERVAGESVSAFYKNQRYYFNRGQGVEVSSYYLRFVPDSTSAICTIENFDKRKTRRAKYAENQFRNTLELRYNKAKDRTWLINELGIEDYLRGLGETSEISHPEFKKALITVARTYALYQWERATKHKSEFFHMNAYADDQVYRGYEYELNNPSIGRSVDDTRGLTVNYEGRTAITPYFSRSDGRTRDWSEVWHGTVDWIKSVSAPCDAERKYKLWGHGVGMSATEALCMADRGSTWEQIAHYFYQGVDIKKRWN